MEIMSGLNHSSIQRLSVWENVSEKFKETFETLEVLMKGQGNFKHYRESVGARKEPVLPYLGTNFSFSFVNIFLTQSS